MAIGTPKASAASATVITAALAGDAQAFRAKLDATIVTTLAARTTASKAAAPAPAPVTAAQAMLQARLKDALDKGIPLDRVIDGLSTQLASSLAAALGLSVADAAAQIKQVVAQALAPPGQSPATSSTGPPGPPPTSADLANRLAATARRIVETAARVATGPPDPTSSTGQEVLGEASRLLAGNPTDAATTARGNPAPGSSHSNRTTGNAPPTDAAPVAVPPFDPSALLRDAATAITTLPTAPTAPAATSAATTAFASTIVAATPVAPAPVVFAPVAAAPLPATTPAATPVPTVPAAPVPAGDGRRVAVDPQILLATGGDTLLGRVLTRAVRAATDPAPAPAPVERSAPRLGTATAPAAVPAPAESARPADTALASFVKKLGDALGVDGPIATIDATVPPSSSDVATPEATPQAAPSDLPLFASFVAPAMADPQPATGPVVGPDVPAPVPPADPSAVVDQLVRGAFGRIASDGSSEMRLRLSPAHLGDLTVKLVVHNGDVAASVLAATSQAHEALVAGTPQLERALSDAGLKLTSFSVAQGGADAFDQRSSSQRRSAPDQRRGTFFGFDSVDGSDDESLSAVPTFGPPLAGGLGGGLGYNHLV